MKEIPLTQGQVAIVDDEDYGELSKYNWYYLATGRHEYAAREGRKNGRKCTIYMHRCIIGTKDGMETDHIKGSGLDNRRGNLRACTHAQNQQNKRAHWDNPTGLPGITIDKKTGQWRADLTVAGKRFYLGRFQTMQQAIEARNTEGIKHQFAKIITESS